ncbi:MAG TPA: alcohol dehydrogenase [Erysipelotrichaceae bacterium]|nr:alcohol dehydrogenase [Erysipelotrichaceae bacterium]
MKNVVITGSTRGIGLAMAIEFLKAGCHVTLSSRGDQLNDRTIKDLILFKDKYIYIPCNVQSKESIQRLWNESVKQWGYVDIWINNAGQNTPHVRTWETDETETTTVIQTNLIGMIFGSQIAAKEMIKQGFGAIYSMEGLGSNNMIQTKTIHYGTTKHALTYYMKGLAKELEGTAVIAGRLSPGMMLTDFITKDSDGNPSEVILDKSFIRIFNILADTPETVAKFFIPRILSNKKNNVQIAWLTNVKVAWRFMTASSRKNRLLKSA